MKRLASILFLLAIIAIPATAQIRRVHLRLIVVRTPTEAADILTRLQGGASFEELARTFSIDGSARAGGDLGTLVLSDLRQEFQDALRGLGPGQVSPIARVGTAYAILQLVGERGSQDIALREGVAAGDAAKAKAALDAGADANLAFDDGSTVLMGAAQGGHTEIVRALLNAGAQSTAQARNGATALLEASFEGHAEIVRLLLEAKADPNTRLDDGSTIVMKAAGAGHTEIVRALIAGGADPNARAKTGLTALMQAAFAGQTAIVRILLDARPDVNARLDNDSTALMAAALGGHTEIVRALIAAGADVKLTADNGSTSLMEAAHAGRLDAVRVLLEAGSDVNATLDNGITALMGAALGGHTEIVNVLIAAGANVSARDRNGWTALTHAAASASLDAVQALLASGIEVDPKERSLVVGRTYINEYYSSNERRLLDLAATEFQKVLYGDPDNLTALEWMGAVEILRWDENLNLQQFRRAIALLKRCVSFDKEQPERYYWIAAANSIFVATGKGASANEYAALLDEGIANALRAIELNPRYWEAMAYLNVLYRQRAERIPAGPTRDQLMKLAATTAEDAIKARDANNGRPSRPNDQFTTPAPPPPPAL